MSKQDRQGVRTATDLERKYGFGKSFAEIMEIATDARNMAEKAEEGIEGLDHDEIFNLLTKDGALQGLYRGEDGDLYINASYIKAGIIKSPDGESLVINLDEGTIDATGSLKTEDVIWLGSYKGKAEMSGNVIKVECKDSSGEVVSGAYMTAGIDGAMIVSPTGFGMEYYVDGIIADEVMTTWGDNQIERVFGEMFPHTTKTIILNLTQATMNGQKGMWFVTLKKESEGNGFVIAQKQDYLKIVSMTKAMTNFLWGDWVMDGNFAPAGYGFGEEAATKAVSDCNDAKLTGLYKVNANSKNSPLTAATFLICESYSANSKKQTIFTNGSTTPVLATRTMSGGSWGNWEYINPPIAAGGEYRTIERWKGKAVYAKHIAQTMDVIGNASSYADYNVAHGISGFVNLVRVEANFNAQFNLPYMGANGDWYGIIEVNSTNIKLRCYKGTWTRPTLNATIYYTKE